MKSDPYTRSLYEIADEKRTTVGELLGTRRRYSRIHVPEKLRNLIGDDFIHVEHYDEGINAAEVQFWGAFWKIKNDEQKKKSK